MFRNHTNRLAVSLMLLSTTAFAQTAYAASYLNTVPKGIQTSHAISLAEITKAQTSNTTRTLDWQQPSVALYFDLPPGERTSDIVLTLSADPLTRVARNAPLEVQFNNSKPVPILSNGNGFEARIPLDAAKSRNRRNVLRITYPIPEGADCVAPAHGAWSVDLSASRLQIEGRAQRRHVNLSEVSEILSHPALSPKKVGLIAHGSSRTDMQALAAQGIALRTPGVPKFSVSSSDTDFNVVMVKRSRLFKITNDPVILNSEGPQVFVPRGRPTELLFTADTDAEILHLLKIFSTRKLPNTRRPIASIGEHDLQNRLGSETPKLEGRASLIDFAVSSNIGPGSQSYKFSVEDPLVSSGELHLKLSTTKTMTEDSRIRVALNGNILGAAKLDKKRKTVAFPIQSGDLNATTNVLNIVPDIAPQTGYTCPTAETVRPQYSIGEKSRLIVNQATPSPVTELSRLTSTGSLFAETQSYIALPERTQDYQAALRVLGRMAKSSGRGFVLADYSRYEDVANDKHVLIIGPSHMVKSHMSGAPKAFRDAMAGQSSTGDNLLQNDFEIYASAGTTDAAVQFAARDTAPRKITRGGIAALYGTETGNLAGVISSAPGYSFVNASNTLVDLDHWNALQGGVARWTDNSVVMAQIAQADTDIRKPAFKKANELPKIGLAAIDFPSLSLPEFDWPEFEWPEINWPDFDMPQVTLPKFSLPSSKPTQTEIAETPTSETAPKDTSDKSLKMAEITPQLKPVFKAETKTGTSGLRGSIQFKEETKTKSTTSFNDFKRATKSKWSATKSWTSEKIKGLRNTKGLDDVAKATDRLQDRVSPTGRSIKAKIQNMLPGKGLVQFGDRTFSVYGLILMMAFGLVLLMMSFATPKSRLGGRH